MASRQKKCSLIAVDVRAMADAHDVDDARPVHEVADDAPVADAVAPGALIALQRFADSPRVASGDVVQLSHDPPRHRRGARSEGVFFPRGGRKGPRPRALFFLRAARCGWGAPPKTLPPPHGRAPAKG